MRSSGRIDVLANVAGIVQFGRFDEITEAEYDRVQAVDLKGPFFLIQAALPHIRAAKGNIVNVSSVAGNKAQGYSAAYSAAKGGLTMLTRGLALELAPEGIRVNAVCPGTVDTPLVQHVAENFPADLDPRVMDRLMMMLPGRAISPAEIGQSIVYLASPAARMITGSILAFDGGMQGCSRRGQLRCAAHLAGVAQLVERSPCKRNVAGSTPVTGSRRVAVAEADRLGP